jgi:hypothetical protein
MMDASKAMVEELFAGCDKLSTLELVKINAKVLVPLIRAFRKEFGSDRTDKIVGEALRQWAQEVFQRIGAQLEGSPVERFDAAMSATIPKIGADVDFETLQQTPEQWNFNVTGCRYADFFRQLGEPELGALLLCDLDVHMTEQLGGGEVKLKRTQTIMKGAEYCDFRWSMKRGPGK